MLKKSQPGKAKPRILLHMQKDETFKRIMTGFFKQSKGDESWEEMGNEALYMLKQNYSILDKDGNDIDDRAALNSTFILLLEVFLSLSLQHSSCSSQYTKHWYYALEIITIGQTVPERSFGRASLPPVLL